MTDTTSYRALKARFQPLFDQIAAGAIEREQHRELAFDAVNQLRDLIEGGADGVHLYAMNDANVAAKVYEGIKDLL